MYTKFRTLIQLQRKKLKTRFKVNSRPKILLVVFVRENISQVNVLTRILCNLWMKLLPLLKLSN
jgi:hypothetical protein